MNTHTQQILERFDENVKELKTQDYPYSGEDAEVVEFGFTTNRNSEIFRVTDFGNIRKFLEQELSTLENAVREQLLFKVKNIILRRTEIPKGARNPTRDSTVILGEELCDLIDDALSSK